MKSYNCKIDHFSMILPPNLIKNKEFFERISLHKFAAAIGKDAFLQLPEEVRLLEAQKAFPLSPESFEEVTMIKQRYQYSAGTSLVDKSTEVLKKGLEEAGWDPLTLDFIIFSSVSDGYPNKTRKIPTVACKVQEEIGAWNAWAYDIKAACSGWVYPVQQATAFIHSGMAKRGAIVITEMSDAGLEYTNEKSSPLIGDVATVTLLSWSDEPGIFDIKCEANTGDPNINSDLITLGYHTNQKEDDSFFYPIKDATTTQKPELPHDPFRLKGKSVYASGIKEMSRHTKDNINSSNTLFGKEPDWFVYHQANGAMLMKILDDLHLDRSKNLYNVDKLANTIGATIPSVLADDWGKIKAGDVVSAVAFGGGITSGRLLFKKL